MLIKISEKLMNKKGSSLAFVLIIGMVMMILVAALLVVANGEFTFTQETLESRQAYIDAKSVIEYGKIEINSRTTALNNINNDLTALYVQYKAAVESSNPNATDISVLKNRIDAAEAQRIVLINALSSEFIIYGNTKNASGTLTSDNPVAPNTAELVELGELKYDPAKNQFRIETDSKNISRKLDYKVGFNYVASTKTETTTGGALVTPSPPTYNGSILTHFSPWNKGEISRYSVNNHHNQYNVYGTFVGLNEGQSVIEDANQVLTLNYPTANLQVDKKIDWTSGRTLELTAHSIYINHEFDPSECSGGKDEYGDYRSHFNMTAVKKQDPTTGKMVPGDIYFVKGYTPDNQGVNTLTAEGGNIVINGDLELAGNSTLNIKCKNLFVTKDIYLKPGNSKLNITAENIVVNGDVTLDHGTSLSTNCPNIWIGKGIETKSADVSVELKNVNYLYVEKNIKLGQATQFIVTGSSINSSQMVVDSILKNDGGNSYKIKITNFASFTCVNFNMNNFSTLQLTAKIINITDEINFEWCNSISIATQYFDCGGNVSILRLLEPLNINPLDGQPLNIRFGKGYSQLNSTVNINGADMVIFGGKSRQPNNSGAINLDCDWYNLFLNVKANNIYLDSNNIDFYDGSSFNYGGKTSTTYANVNAASNIWSSYGTLGAGNYRASALTEKIPYSLTYQSAYTPPIWVSPPSSTSKAVVVTSGSVGLNGSEIYY